MESEWEREIRELLESVDCEPIEDLLKEIALTPIPFIDFEPTLKPRKTRKKANDYFCKCCRTIKER